MHDHRCIATNCDTSPIRSGNDMTVFPTGDVCKKHLAFFHSRNHAFRTAIVYSQRLPWFRKK